MYKYYIAEGWIHPKHGGDDYPFIRGFRLKAEQKMEDLRKHIIKQHRRKSAHPEDFNLREVSEEEWSEMFTI